MMDNFWTGFEKRAAEGDRYLHDSDYGTVKIKPETERALRAAGKGALVGGLITGAKGGAIGYLRGKGGTKEKLLNALSTGGKAGLIGAGVGGTWAAGHHVGKHEGAKEYSNLI